MHAGLALATSLAGIINAVILLSCLVSKKYYKPKPGLLFYLIKLVGSVLIMTFVLHQMTPDLNVWLTAKTIWRITHLAMLVFSGAITYILSMSLLGYRLTQFTIDLKMT